jgi:DNA-binding transcriptional regulator/RsmH inhibitor MraZ
MKVGSKQPTFLWESPSTVASDDKGRVAIPAGFVRILAKFQQEADAAEPDAPDAADAVETGEPGDERSGLSVFLTIDENEPQTLRIYPLARWESYIRDFDARVKADPGNVALAKLYRSVRRAGSLASVDRQNRLRIPDFLFSLLGLEKKTKLSFLGEDDHIALGEERDCMDAIASSVSENNRAVKEEREKRLQRGSEDAEAKRKAALKADLEAQVSAAQAQAAQAALALQRLQSLQ